MRTGLHCDATRGLAADITEPRGPGFSDIPAAVDTFMLACPNTASPAAGSRPLPAALCFSTRSTTAAFEEFLMRVDKAYAHVTGGETCAQQY
jgi:hypothetical protein